MSSKQERGEEVRLIRERAGQGGGGCSICVAGASIRGNMQQRPPLMGAVVFIVPLISRDRGVGCKDR